MATKVQLTGGAFQDPEGNPLANGYLIMELSQDSIANSTDQICAGFKIKITLDSSGNVVTSPAQYVWPNDVLSPAGTFYMVSGYSAVGELVWGPNAQQVLSTPSPYDIGAWVPGTVNTLNGPIPTYDIGIFVQGAYTASQLVMLLKLERQIRFQTNFSPSTATVGTNPAGTVTFIVNKNGSQVCTVAINSSGAATFTGSATIFNAGDVLTVVAPSGLDLTGADYSILLSGVVTGA